MKCPDCGGEIEIDNSVNEMSPHCVGCKKYWEQSYLGGYRDGYEAAISSLREVL